MDATAFIYQPWMTGNFNHAQQRAQGHQHAQANNPAAAFDFDTHPPTQTERNIIFVGTVVVSLQSFAGNILNIPGYIPGVCLYSAPYRFMLGTAQITAGLALAAFGFLDQLLFTSLENRTWTVFNTTCVSVGMLSCRDGLDNIIRSYFEYLEGGLNLICLVYDIFVAIGSRANY